MVLPTTTYVAPKSLGPQSASLGYDPKYEVNAAGSVTPTGTKAARAGTPKDVGTLVDPEAPAISAKKALGAGIAAKNIKGQKLAAGEINQARGDEQAIRTQQGRLIPALQAAAAGQGPSAAQIASRANLNQLSLAQERAAASIRGGAPAMYAAQHAAAAGLNPLQAQAITAGAAARAAEMQRAQAVLAQHLLATRQGDIGMAGTDAAIASRNADLAQYAATANQANQLRAGQANLADQVNAGSLDLNDQVRMAMARQAGGLQTQEAQDARAIGQANLGLGEAQTGLAAVNAANAGYLGQLGLDVQGARLQAQQTIGNEQRDAAFWSGLLSGGAAPLALASIPAAQPAPAPAAAPAAAAPVEYASAGSVFNYNPSGAPVQQVAPPATTFAPPSLGNAEIPITPGYGYG